MERNPFTRVAESLLEDYSFEEIIEACSLTEVEVLEYLFINGQCTIPYYMLSVGDKDAEEA